MKKQLFLFVLFFLCLYSTKAQGFIVGSLQYVVLDGNNVEVKLPDGMRPQKMVIPSTVTYLGTTYHVESVAWGAFEDNPILESVVVSDGISIIKDGAFANCPKLHTLTIPSTIKEIEEFILSRCESINKIIVRAKEPCKVTDQTFDNWDVLLLVPKGSLEKYKNAPIWCNFKNIQEFDEEVTKVQTLDNKKSLINIYANSICIGNVSKGQHVDVYSVDGCLIGQYISNGGPLEIELERNKLYLIKINKKIYKIVL